MSSVVNGSPAALQSSTQEYISLVIRTVEDEPHQVTFDNVPLSWNGARLREEISRRVPTKIPEHLRRLIVSDGRIRDQDTLADLKIQNGHTITVSPFPVIHSSEIPCELIPMTPSLYLLMDMEANTKQAMLRQYPHLQFVSPGVKPFRSADDVRAASESPQNYVTVPIKTLDGKVLLIPNLSLETTVEQLLKLIPLDFSFLPNESPRVRKLVFQGEHLPDSSTLLDIKFTGIKKDYFYVVESVAAPQAQQSQESTKKGS